MRSVLPDGIASKIKNPGLALRDRGFARWRGLVAVAVAVVVRRIVAVAMAVAVAVTIAGRSGSRREHRAERSNGHEGQNGLADHWVSPVVLGCFLTSCCISRFRFQTGSP